MKNSLGILILLVSWINLPVYSQTENLELSVNVSGASANHGQVLFSLFSSKQNYLKDPVSEQVSIVDGSDEAQFVQNNLSPGVYAVSVIYDTDNNHELNTNIFGIPTELVGLSNNARARFVPPSFEKSSFELVRTKSINISLGKAKNN